MKTTMASLAVLALICLGTLTAEAEGQPVDLELVLLVDASNSIDQVESQLQRQGYADALRHPDVLKAIRYGPSGRVAISFMEWADVGSQDVVVPWMVIAGENDARVFGERLVAVLPVVTIAAALMSPLLVPLARWCLRLKRAEWTEPVDDAPA